MENTDLISRAKALNAIKNELAYQEDHAIPGEDIDTGIICGLRQAAKIVKGIDPSAEKTGKWILNDNGTYSCSLCQSWIPNEQHHYARYCLCCGARMEG